MPLGHSRASAGGRGVLAALSALPSPRRRLPERLAARCGTEMKRKIADWEESTGMTERLDIHE